MASLSELSSSVSRINISVGITSKASSGSMLMDLPAEVRLIILEYLLRPGTVYIYNKNSNVLMDHGWGTPRRMRPKFATTSNPGLAWTPNAEFKPSTQILFTNRQIFCEGLSILYRSNVIHVIDQATFRDFGDYLRMIGPINRSLIRHLEISRKDGTSTSNMQSRQSTSIYMDLSHLDLGTSRLDNTESLNIHYGFQVSEKVFFGLRSTDDHIHDEDEFNKWWNRIGVAAVLNVRSGMSKLRYVVGSKKRLPGQLLVRLISDKKLMNDDTEYLAGSPMEAPDSSEDGH